MSSAVDRTVISFLRLFFFLQEYVIGVPYFIEEDMLQVLRLILKELYCLIGALPEDIPPCTLELEVASR